MNYEESPIGKMVEEALNEALGKDQNFKITKSNLKKLVKETLLEEAISKREQEIKRLDESITSIEEDGIPYEYQDFDALDFKTTAKSAAAQDIEDEFGTPMDSISDEEQESMSSDLERANLRLPSDEDELAKLKSILDKKAAAKKSMGAFSLNEGDIPTLSDSMITLEDEEQNSLQDMLQNKLAQKQANRPKSSLFFKDLDFMNESSNARIMELTGLIKENFEGERLFENDDEVDPIAAAKTASLNTVDWEAQGLEYAGDNWYGLSPEEKDEIISDLKRGWHS